MSIKSKKRVGVETVVGEGSQFDGKIVVADGLRVDGVLTGRLEVGGKLRIGRTGQVVADIVCARDVVVAGRVEGNLTCAGEIRLEPSAIVIGDVSGLLLIVDEGAVLRGMISVGGVEEVGMAEDGLRRAANA